MAQENLSKNDRLRKAICQLTAFDPVPAKVSVDDVQKVMPLLVGTGAGPLAIANLANGNDISDDDFNLFMTKMNSYL